MQVPITDAFDADSQLKSVTVRLHSEQLDWLQKKASDLDLSLNHVARAVVNAHMRRSDVFSNDSKNETASEESVVDQLRSANARLQEFMKAKDSPKAGADDGSNPRAKNAASRTEAKPSAENPATDHDDSESSMTSEALLNQLRENMRGDGSPDRDSTEPALSALDEDDTRSMFDMVDEEE